MNNTWLDRFLDAIRYVQITEFIKNWIYPAYYLKNLLFNRYDRIKVPQVKPYEYTDISYLMLCANMQMIVNFIEKENPEKHICWYTDKETGEELGHKYGECKHLKTLYPEYKNKWIMDIIKEIYYFWKVEYPAFEKDNTYLLFFWHEYFCNIDSDLNEKKIATSMDDFKPDVKWNILDKYIDRNRLFEQDYLIHVRHHLENEMENTLQKYLHLAIEVRPYLWT
jgi:hypothetical protein